MGSCMPLGEFEEDPSPEFIRANDRCWLLKDCGSGVEGAEVIILGRR